MALVEINRNPSRRELKQFAGIWFPLFFLIVGIVVWRRADSLHTAACIWTVGVAISAVAFITPRVARPLFIGWMTAAFPIGWVMSHIVLAVAFYGLFTPLGLAMRLAGRDPLNRRFEPSADTYWVKRGPERGKSSYLRQF